MIEENGYSNVKELASKVELLISKSQCRKLVTEYHNGNSVKVFKYQPEYKAD